MIDSWLKNFEKQQAAREKARSIWCPHCGAEYRDEDYDYVTYWGEHDGDWEPVCDECEKPFELIELVERTYETKKLKGANGSSEEGDNEVLEIEETSDSERATSTDGDG